MKPQFCEGVIKEIREEIKENQVILSIVAGKKLEWLEAQFGKKCKIIRTMPNTPALVGEGITGVCPNDQVTEKEVKEALVLLRSFGRADTVTETILDVVGAVSEYDPLGKDETTIVDFAGNKFRCSQWCDVLKLGTARAYAEYAEGFYRCCPAITVNEYCDYDIWSMFFCKSSAFLYTN